MSPAPGMPMRMSRTSCSGLLHTTGISRASNSNLVRHRSPCLSGFRWFSTPRARGERVKQRREGLAGLWGMDGLARGRSPLRSAAPNRIHLRQLRWLSWMCTAARRVMALCDPPGAAPAGRPGDARRQGDADAPARVEIAATGAPRGDAVVPPGGQVDAQRRGDADDSARVQAAPPVEARQGAVHHPNAIDLPELPSGDQRQKILAQVGAVAPKASPTPYIDAGQRTHPEGPVPGARPRSPARPTALLRVTRRARV